MLETYINQIQLSITTKALLLGLAVGAISYKLLKKKYKLPPGPWAPPLLGNLLSLTSSTPLYRQVAGWATKYGAVVTFYFGPYPCVMLNSAEVVNEALVKKGADFAGRAQSYSISCFSEGYKDIIFADVSTQWKIQRKIAHQGLRQYVSGNLLVEKLFESASKVMTTLKKEEGQIIDMEKYISLTVFNLLYGVCFNKSFEIDDKLFVQMMENLDIVNAEFGAGVWEDMIPLLRIYPTKRFTKIMANFAQFLDCIKAEYKTHQENYSEDNLKDFTDFLINARKQEVLDDPEIETLITDDHLIHTINDIFAAGVDTTRQTLTWTIFLLVKHPEIQKKLHAELDQVIEAGEAPTIQDRERLPYTEAVLHESMRICPVAPFGVPHATRCDTTLGEYKLPMNTTVMVNHWALHMDPNEWDEPEVFRPERFLDEDGQIAPKTMSWLPFSAGRRNCLGETIARPEMHLLLALLVRNFEFRSAEGKPLNLTPNGNLAFLPPKNDLIVIGRK